MMRRILAATVAIWAVIAIALVIAISHRTTASSQASAPTTVVVVRQANGQLSVLPVATHATTQTSGVAASNQLGGIALNGQLTPSSGSTNHATTRSS
jgi:hypothetical protein